MWVSWLIALAALILGAYYFWHNNRRKTLELDVTLTRLLAFNVESRDDLEVRFKGQVVRDPHIVDFHIANVGQKDIASNDFDAGKSLRVEFNSAIVSRLEVSKDAPMLTVSPDSRGLLLVPHKIAAGSSYQTRVLVDGQVRLDISEDPLLDTNVVVGDHRRLKELKRLAAVMATSSTMALLGVIGFACILVNRDRIQTRQVWLVGRIPTSPTWAAYVMYSLPALLTILIASMLYAVTRMRRMRVHLDRLTAKDLD